MIPKADLRTRLNRLMMVAARGDNLARALVLLDAGGDVNATGADGNALLHLAARSGQEAWSAALLSRPGIDVNLPNGHGQTPLHIAVRNGRHDLVRQLLARRETDPNVRDHCGDTPLHLLGMKTGCREMADAFLSHPRVDPVIRNRHGETPLRLAIMNWNTHLVAELAGHRHMDVDIPDWKGVTPLQVAAEYANAEVIELLLDAGADPARKNADGTCAFDIHPAVILSWRQRKAVLERRRRFIRCARPPVPSL